jgi:hypothetical protein
MALSEAMNVAMRLHHSPVMIRQVRRTPLPRDIVNLLEIAVGDPRALTEAAQDTEIPTEKLQQAAGFFIEQILFHHRSDSYRILGAQPDDDRAEIARNLRLLMKWVHPDGLDQLSSGSDIPAIDRSVFAPRVTAAWNDLKTKARRAAYDHDHPNSTPRRSDCTARQGGSGKRSSQPSGAWTVAMRHPAARQRQPIARPPGVFNRAALSPDRMAPRRRASPLRRLFDFLMSRR